ncbi:hypothetical protein V8B97DRAFT_1916005 [Scleroderma yunnanense]
MPKNSNSGSYSYTGSGTNDQGNHYCSRDYGSAGTGYHYSNQYIHIHITSFIRDGSYYYSNPNGSTYYSSESGYSQYTSPSGDVYKSSGSKGFITVVCGMLSELLSQHDNVEMSYG